MLMVFKSLIKLDMACKHPINFTTFGTGALLITSQYVWLPRDTGRREPKAESGCVNSAGEKEKKMELSRFFNLFTLCRENASRDEDCKISIMFFFLISLKVGLETTFCVMKLEQMT